MPSEASSSKRWRVTFVGVGNDYRRDDAAGLAVARRVSHMASADIRIVESSGDPQQLVGLCRDTDAVVFIDAMSSDRPAGSVERFDVSLEQLTESGFSSVSSHIFDLPNTVELARSLEVLPGTTLIYGIEGSDFEFGEGITQEVQSGVEQVASELEQDWTA